MKISLLLTAILLYTALILQIHAQAIDKVTFFESDSILHAKLSTNIGKLVQSRLKPEYIPATFSCTMPDSNISEKVRIIARGNMRRKTCSLPPVKINFHNETSPVFNTLGSLKLVSGCFLNDYGDQLVLKEYLIYKIYNLLTEKSFHVRLLDLSLEDENGKRKPSSQHAFLIEDEKALAKRNECKAVSYAQINPGYADRSQMNLVSIFEYMIGNTDYGFTVNHNTILIQSKADSTSKPFIVPYDFDYSGLVNADYAVPAEGIEIDNVRQRYYMGFLITPNELNNVIAIFNNQKDKIYSLINNFQLLTEKNRKDIIYYLDDFYKTINNNREAKNIFVNGSRKA